MKQKIKAIILDIDGTLVTDDRLLLSKTANTLKEATTQGIKVILCSGRPFSGLTNLLDQLGINHQPNQYAIAYNGGLITRTNDQSLLENSLTVNQFLRANNWAKDRKLNLIALTKNDIYTLNPYLNQYSSFISYKNSMPIHFMTESEITEKEDSLTFFKLLLAGEKNEISKGIQSFPKWFNTEFYPIHAEDVYVDIMAPNVNKGWAVHQISKSLNIPTSEIMAVGNANNDIEMIRAAGIGIAVNNSTPDLKANADFITQNDNNHDAVGEAVRKFI